MNFHLGARWGSLTDLGSGFRGCHQIGRRVGFSLVGTPSQTPQDWVAGPRKAGCVGPGPIPKRARPLEPGTWS